MSRAAIVYYVLTCGVPIFVYALCLWVTLSNR